MDELRYMRAYTAARMEINRDRLTSRAADVKKHGFMNSSNGGSSIAGRVLGAIGYVDMALIGWRLFRRVFKTVRMLRRN